MILKVDLDQVGSGRRWWLHVAATFLPMQNDLHRCLHRAFCSFKRFSVISTHSSQLPLDQLNEGEPY